MIAPYFPSILVPIIGIFLPGIAMAALFIYIEKESVEWYYTQHFFFFYKEEPSPEYEPKINTPKIVKTPNPPTTAISHKGTRLLVSAIINCNFIKKYLNYF
jgi:photosystem I reaction center subunit VIII